MSHFSEVKTQMNNRRVLEDTLRQMGLKFESDKEGLPIRGFMGECARAEICVQTGINYDLGLQQSSDGNFEFVADFEVIESTPARDLKNKILQTYAYQNIIQVAQERGFQVEKEVREDGQIQMVVSKW